MAGVKFGAHPLVVAVAMGLLGPNALAEENDEKQGESFHTSVVVDDVPEPPTADEFTRVEDLWHEVRTQL